MFESLGLRNFKAYESLEVELRPLTIFLGPNNSGKSSILAAFKILAQTAQSDDMAIPLLLNGKYGDFGTYKDVVHSNNTKRHMEISVSKRLKRHGFLYRNDNLKGRRVKMVSKFRYRSVRREVVLNASALYLDDECLLATGYSTETDRPAITHLGGSPIPRSEKSSLSKAFRPRNFLPIDGTVLSPEREFDNRTTELLRRCRSIYRDIYLSFARLSYVAALRAMPLRTFLYTGERRREPGVSGEHAPSILAMDRARGGAKSKGILEKCKFWLHSAGIASDIEIKNLSDRHYEVRLQHPETGEYENFADTGYGNSQVLPILVAGYSLQPGETFLVEQPEIHLHPRAQSELANFFFDLLQNNVQSLVETHSEHFVLRAQQLVASGKIDSSDVVVYYVYAKDGKKNVQKMELDSKGAFVNEWPEGFFPERLIESKKLAQLRHGK